MEHLLVLLVELGRWIDRQFQKRLRRMIPDLDRLLRDPRGTLAGEPLVIGPAQKYGTGVLVGLLVAGVTWLVVLLTLLLAAERNVFPLHKHPAVLIFLVAFLVLTLLASIWLTLYVLRGGEMVLSESGVELRYRRSVVYCPWALFNTPGQPFMPRPDAMLLPVATAAIPYVEVRRDGALQATGERVHTTQLRFKSGTEARLKPLYEVVIADLGSLLLELGRRLGAALPDTARASLDFPVQEAPTLPMAAVAPDGWMTVRLTRLVFPPFCCDCGAPTDRLQEFRGHSVVLRLGRFGQLAGGEFARFQIPVCRTCHRENRKAQRYAFLKGLGFGLAAPLLVCLALWVVTNNARVLLMFPPLAFLGSLIGMTIGQAVGKRNAAPVQLQRYSPSQGTIAIRFRWPEYGERVLAFMEVQDAVPGYALTARAGAGRS